MSAASLVRSGRPLVGRLAFASLLYVAWSIVAGIIAIARGLPAEFGGSESQNSVTQEFVYGMGTALSPPLYWLVVLLVSVALLPRADVWGTVGAAVLTASGVLTFVGALGEPITWRVLAPATFDPLLALIQAGMIVIPVAVAIFGWQEFRRRRTQAGHEMDTIRG